MCGQLAHRIMPAPIRLNTDTINSAGSTALICAGADLDFVIARRCPDKPGEGVVFVSPLRGDEEVKAAGSVGFSTAQSLHAVRVQGDDRPGVGAELLSKLGDSGINARGFSAAAMGKQFIAYIAFDPADDASRAVDLLSS